MLDEGVTSQAELVSASLSDVHGRKETVPLGGQRGLRRLSVVELPDPVRVAAGLQDAAGGVDDVEPVCRLALIAAS